MRKSFSLIISLLLSSACYQLNNRHDGLAVQCDLNGRATDRVLVQFTNPGGIELTREQVAQLQVQYEGLGNQLSLTLTSRACVTLPVGAARLKAKIAGDSPLTAELTLDESAAQDTIHKVELEAPGVLIMDLKCPENGLLAADALQNIVDVKKAIGKLNGYSVDLSIQNSTDEKLRSLFTKNSEDVNLNLPSSFDIQKLAEGNYLVQLTVKDSYHGKDTAASRSQCKLTVRRSCAQDEDFDPRTVSCVPKLCDNAYRVGAKWTDSLPLQRGEGRYECRLEKGQAEKVMLSHSCQAGFFRSETSCLAATKIAGSCALLENNDVTCWGTVIGKDNYPSRKDINMQTTLTFESKVKKFDERCVELENSKIQCWSIVYDDKASYRFMSEAETPKSWAAAQAADLVNRSDACRDPSGSCNFRPETIDGKLVMTPSPNGASNCLVDASGSVWCNRGTVPGSQALETSLTALPYYKVNLTQSARQVRSEVRTACALLMDSSVVCWGDNSAGAVGSNTSVLSVQSPTNVIDSMGASLANIQQLASTYDFSGQPTIYALSKDGRVFAWGSNLEGNVASGSPGEDDEGNAIFSRFAVPVSVESINPIRR